MRFDCSVSDGIGYIFDGRSSIRGKKREFYFLNYVQTSLENKDEQLFFNLAPETISRISLEKNVPLKIFNYHTTCTYFSYTKHVKLALLITNSG
jgi:hypothetical protein